MHWCHKRTLLARDEDKELLTNFMCPIHGLSDHTETLCLFFAGNSHGRMRVQAAITQGKGSEEKQKAVSRESIKREVSSTWDVCGEQGTC